MIRTNVYQTEILEWREGVPVIAVGRYTARSVYWFCSECKMFHYHWPTDGLVVKCYRGDWTKGVYIKIVEG